jgi:DNA polymerase III epsilon subunit-like protein
MKPTNETFALDWRNFEYAVVDIEGTGAQHREKEGIVDIAVVIVEGGSVSERKYHQLLDPGIKIPVFVSRIHGIYDKDVSGRPIFENIRPSLERFLGQRYLVAHNASVERRVLNSKLPTYQPQLIFDTLKMARVLYGTGYRHGLEELIDRLGLRSTLPATGDDARHHGALYDAAAAAKAFVHMAYENFPGGCPLEDLAEMCAIERNVGPDGPRGLGGPESKQRRQANFGWS